MISRRSPSSTTARIFRGTKPYPAHSRASGNPATGSPLSRGRAVIAPARHLFAVPGGAHQPRQDHLAEDHRIGPALGLAAHVAAGRVDPGFARLAGGVA